MAVLSLSQVEAEIDVILLAQVESEPSANAREQFVISKLARSWSDFPDTSECRKSEPLRQLESILELGGEHPSVDVPARHISSKLIIRSEDTLPVEWGFTVSSAEKKVVGKYLAIAQTGILVECESVRLKRKIMATR